jgi:hypothetical protein
MTDPWFPEDRRDVVLQVEEWFFGQYLPQWVHLGADQADPRGVLEYWGVPMHAASVRMVRWLRTDDDVLGLLEANQAPLREQGYAKTAVLDRRITVYNAAATAIDVIWSRRRADDSEIERLAVHFEVRRTDGPWRVIALASTHTEEEELSDVWFVHT